MEWKNELKILFWITFFFLLAYFMPLCQPGLGTEIFRGTG